MLLKLHVVNCLICLIYPFWTEVWFIKYAAPEITPLELKEKLDSGKEIVFLDTRNDYEMRVGTFEGASATTETIFICCS